MALIFVLDDQEDACQLMRRILSDAGHRAETFTDPGEAMEWLRTNSPQLALLDFKPKRSGGLDIIRYIRTSRPEIKTMLITSSPSAEVEKQARELGFEDYLIKPLGIDEIERHINKALGLS